jgi:hypothetical protein
MIVALAFREELGNTSCLIDKVLQLVWLWSVNSGYSNFISPLCATGYESMMNKKKKAGFKRS